jgi:hypothetical protein
MRLTLPAAAFAALVLAAPAGAVNCFTESVKAKLDGADVAFVGKVVAVTPVSQSTGVALFDYRFRVERAVKGRLGTTATIRAAKLVDIDAQPVTAGSGVDIGVLATRAGGRARLVASSCSLVDPGSLLGAADEPKGALIKVAIGFVILGLVLAYSLRRLRRRNAGLGGRAGRPA